MMSAEGIRRSVNAVSRNGFIFCSFHKTAGKVNGVKKVFRGSQMLPDRQSYKKL